MDAVALSQRLADGEAALAAGDYRRAAELLDPVAQALPGHLAVARMVSRAWQLGGSRHRARAALLPAVGSLLASADSAPPADTEVFDLAALLLELGAPDEALACFALVQRTRPNNPAVLGGMAGALRALGKPDEAWTLVQQALATSRKDPALLLTAAQIRHAQGDLTDALAWLKRAENVRPNHSGTRMQRALTRLLGGVSRHGWSDFEARGLPAPPRGVPLWTGDALNGRSVLVLAEQGLGDLYHFLRFVPLLAEQGAGRVVIQAPPAVHSLLQASGFEVLAPDQADHPIADVAVPLLSLPYRLATDTTTLGDRVPYLRTGDEAHRTSEDARPPHLYRGASLLRLADVMADARPGPRRLGLVLSGNPDYLATNLRDADASVALALAHMPGISWTWLQPGTQPPNCLAHIHQPDLTADWLATARLIATLDGVVTVDTGMAHLAGAMGVPVGILLPFTPDWRWGARGTESAWYPSATLFRQSRPADWSAAVDALHQLLTAPSGSP